MVNAFRRSILLLVVAVWAAQAQAQARIDSNVVYVMLLRIGLADGCPLSNAAEWVRRPVRSGQRVERTARV